MTVFAAKQPWVDMIDFRAKLKDNESKGEELRRGRQGKVVKFLVSELNLQRIQLVG